MGREVTAVAIALAVTVAGAIVALVWLSYRGDKRNDAIRAADARTAEVREQLGVQVLETERAKFERNAEQAKRQEVEAINEAITKELADAIETVSVGAGLLPGDVRGRLLRIAQARQAAARRGALSAGAGEAVHQPTATGGSDTANVPAVDSRDVLERPGE